MERKNNNVTYEKKTDRCIVWIRGLKRNSCFILSRPKRVKYFLSWEVQPKLIILQSIVEKV